MLRGMAQMDLKRRLTANRTLSVTMTFLALVGWGAFAYAAGSSVSTERQLRAELAQSTAAQDQLLAERNQQQAAVGDLGQLQAKLASAREDLETLAQKREQARAQIAAAHQELMVLTKRRDEKQAKVSETERARATKPVSKPAQLAART
jgi:chromosome segregation ATPase